MLLNSDNFLMTYNAIPDVRLAQIQRRVRLLYECSTRIQQWDVCTINDMKYTDNESCYISCYTYTRITLTSKQGKVPRCRGQGSVLKPRMHPVPNEIFSMPWMKAVYGSRGGRTRHWWWGRTYKRPCLIFLPLPFLSFFPASFK